MKKNSVTDMFRRWIICVLCFLLLLSCGAKKPSVAVRYNIEVVAEYPHSRTSYTQGLFFDNGILYESTGQNGESRFGVLDMQSGELDTKVELDGKYFGEGSVFFGGRLYYLTWRGLVAFTYDSGTFAPEGRVVCPREGWGLTTDGKSLIMSDGSSSIWFMDEDFRTRRRISVKNGGKAVSYLNELEWIEGKIWANVYTSDHIVIINPETGEVEGIVNCKGLLDNELRDAQTDVLNGIAYDPETKRIFLTGKNWPRMFEVRLLPVE